jgi:hypothetical protein
MELEREVTKINRPDSPSIFYIGAKTRIIGEYDKAWITLACLGGDDRILLNENEWPGFVALVSEIDDDFRKDNHN